MKFLLLLLLSFNSFAAHRLTMTDLRDNSIQGTKRFDTEILAVARLVEIAKIKNNWREGIFNEVAENSLYSKVEDVITHVETGEIGNVFDAEGNIVDTYPITEKVVTPTTYYYHPTNWSYTIAPADQEVADELALEVAKEAQKTERIAVRKLRSDVDGMNIPVKLKRIIKLLLKEMRKDS